MVLLPLNEVFGGDKDSNVPIQGKMFGFNETKPPRVGVSIRVSVSGSCRVEVGVFD